MFSELIELFGQTFLGSATVLVPVLLTLILLILIFK